MSTRSDRTSIPTARTSRTGLGSRAWRICRSWIIRSRTTSTSRLRGLNGDIRSTSTKRGGEPQRQQLLDGGIVELDMPHRQDDTPGRGRRDQGVRLVEIRRDRLLHQHVNARLDQTRRHVQVIDGRHRDDGDIHDVPNLVHPGRDGRTML